MNLICLDGFDNLQFKFLIRKKTDEEHELERFLKIAKFQRVDSDEWLFRKTLDEVQFIKKADSIIKKCSKLEIPLDVCKKLKQKIDFAKNDISFREVVEKGQKIKDFCPVCTQRWDNHNESQFSVCSESYPYPPVSSNFKRILNPVQKLSVDHLIQMGNAANFSVPGSGKTTVTYAALSRWIEDKIINKILVIGPTPSFFPWEDEYRECFGKEANSIRPTGSEVEKLNKFNCELYLVHFSTVMGKTENIIDFLKNPDNDVAVVIDESHNIKNIGDDAKWATAVRQIAPFAKRKIILSGTPMPNGARDLWVQINFLWPHENLLGNKNNFRRNADRHGIRDWKDTIYPLFTRIRKKDLRLDNPQFRHYNVNLSHDQREIYDAICESTLREIKSFRSKNEMQKFRKARLIRMLQVTSNPSLLVEEHNEEFNLESQCGIYSTISPEPLDSDIYEKILNYSKNYAIPAKLVQTAELAKKLIENGEKVIIWSTFVKNIRILQNQLLKKQKPIVIYGDISKDIEKEVNRDKLIKEFKDNPDPCILIATPPTLSESVSLHIDQNRKRVCSHAIYLDRNYNAAQYVQSMDRIHRVGMDTSDKTSFSIKIENDGKLEERIFSRNTVYYHMIIANNTIDNSINDRLNDKFEKMNDALNDDWPTTLDYDGKSVKVSINISDESAKNDLISLVNSMQDTVNSNAK